jgi:hypothetical protein
MKNMKFESNKTHTALFNGDLAFVHPSKKHPSCWWAYIIRGGVLLEYSARPFTELGLPLWIAAKLPRTITWSKSKWDGEDLVMPTSKMKGSKN